MKPTRSSEPLWRFWGGQRVVKANGGQELAASLSATQVAGYDLNDQAEETQDCGDGQENREQKQQVRLYYLDG